ncbi:MAG: hypothetical protein HZY75_13170 [Nocardioidaceae bacterium]|nr:MAG: hypothetical protein HZY75_13170 [Nocardioidaceae bacterium]
MKPATKRALVIGISFGIFNAALGGPLLLGGLVAGAVVVVIMLLEADS